MADIKHRLVKDFLTVNELILFQKYCYNKLDLNKDYVIDNQSFSPVLYNDPLKLYPTYAYWRYYIFGATLKNHVDREACEISVTVCIHKYDNWPLIVGEEEIELEEGDAIIYPGYSDPHGRPGTYKGEGMAQVFLHYVDQDGPFKDFKYDNKKGKINV